MRQENEKHYLFNYKHGHLILRLKKNNKKITKQNKNKTKTKTKNTLFLSNRQGIFQNSCFPKRLLFVLRNRIPKRLDYEYKDIGPKKFSLSQKHLEKTD